MHLQLTTEARRRFDSLVYRIPGGCHIWIGRTHSRGYGMFYFRGHQELAHRASWLLSGRVITAEKPFVLHNCPGGDWPSCVNPEHLWNGTCLENNLDMAIKGRGRKSKYGLPYGVSCNGKKFNSMIRVNGRSVYLGTYCTKEKAHTVAIEAKRIRLATLDLTPWSLSEAREIFND